jgi:hypothetical protein
MFCDIAALGCLVTKQLLTDKSSRGACREKGNSRRGERWQIKLVGTDGTTAAVRSGYKEVDLQRKLIKTDELFEESIDPEAFCSCIAFNSKLVEDTKKFIDLLSRSNCGQSRKKSLWWHGSRYTLSGNFQYGSSCTRTLHLTAF